MAKEATQPVRTSSFRRITPKSGQRARIKRYPMSGKLFPSGRFEMNRTSQHSAQRLALGKGLTEGYHVVLAVNEAAETVAIYIVPVNSQDSIQARRLSSGGLSISLDDALDELPGLRPTSRVKCSVTETVDDQGEPCLVVNLGAQLTHAKRPVQEAAPATQGTEKKSETN